MVAQDTSIRGFQLEQPTQNVDRQVAKNRMIEALPHRDNGSECKCSSRNSGSGRGRGIGAGEGAGLACVAAGTGGAAGGVCGGEASGVSMRQ